MNAHMTAQLENETLKMILHEKLSKFNARDLMRLYTKIFGGYVDYHEFSNLLDQWNTQEIVKVVGFNNDGMCIYALK